MSSILDSEKNSFRRRNEKYVKDLYEINRVLVNLDGEKIKKTPYTNPYDYDTFVVWKGDYVKGRGLDVCSDRLYQLDKDRYRECSIMVFGKVRTSFDTCGVVQIEEFLSKYFSKNVRLLAVSQACNKSNGYPYWIFNYEYV